MATLSPEEIAYQQARLHEDRGPMVVAVSIVMMALPVLAVPLRFMARPLRKMPLSWDDWLCIPSLIMILAQGAIIIYSVQMGLGKHLLATNPHLGYKIHQAGYFLSISYYLGIFFVKFVILFTYARILTLRTRWFKWAVYAGFAYVTIWTFVPFVIIFIQCKPISYFWQRFNLSLDPPAVGKCTLDAHQMSVSTGILNTVCDYYLLFIPMPVLWNLNLSIQKKIGVTAIFMIGAFGCIASSLRIQTTIANWSDPTDTTWDSTSIYLWTVIESSVGLICACFPVIGPLSRSFCTRISSMVSLAGYRSSAAESKASGGAWSDGSASYRERLDSQDKDKGFIRRTDEFAVTSVA